MSLQLAANHLAAQGRGPDTTLVHMSPREVAGLQALAKAHGGSLTVNPQTGLPEAGFLDKLLPTILGAAITAFTGIPAWAVGLGIGGIEAARTGDLGKGLMAGLGAYGGAGITGALSSMGETALGGALTSEAAQSAAGETARQTALAQGFGEAGAQQVAQNVAETPLSEFASRAAPTPWEKLSAGAQQLTQEGGASKLLDALGGPTKATLMGMGVVSPLLAAESTQAKMPQTVTPMARITPYRFDPYTQGLTSLGSYKPEEFPGFAKAKGGLASLADGGVADGGVTPSYQRTDMSPGMLDFAQRSEPVVRMADGGATREEVLQAYANTPGAVLTPTEGAINYWMGQGLGGFGGSVEAARAQMSPEQLTSIDAQRAAAIAPAPTQALAPTAVTPIAGAAEAEYQPVTPSAENLSNITNIYRNVLGRDPDVQGLNYWATRLQSGESPESVYGALQQSAKTVLGPQATTLAPQLGTMGLEAAMRPYGLPSSPSTVYSMPQGMNTTIGDEWIRNVLGRAPTVTDASQGWYKALNSIRSKEGLNAAYNAFLQANRVSPDQAPDWFTASQLKPGVAPRPAQQSATYGGTSGVTNANLTMQNVVDKYTQGGGQIAPSSVNRLAANERPAVQNAVVSAVNDFIAANPTATMGEIQSWAAANNMPMAQVYAAVNEHRFNQLTGSSKSAYDYLMGRGNYPVNQQLAGGVPLVKPYAEATGLSRAFNFVTPEMATKMAGATPASTASTTPPGFDPAKNDRNELFSKTKAPSWAAGEGKKWVWSDSTQQWVSETDPTYTGYSGSEGVGGGAGGEANGGMIGRYALGGPTSLGDYSDGGRLLRGPGDGVSDSIPATIGNRQPARLADGEFVVPARIVSELGNGSTNAGAKKLYAMMDRIQANRKRSIGKGKIAVNSLADKYLPA